MSLLLGELFLGFGYRLVVHCSSTVRTTSHDAGNKSRGWDVQRFLSGANWLLSTFGFPGGQNAAALSKK